MPKRIYKRLKRLDPARYEGRAYVHWSLTIEARRTGWLDDSFHEHFRKSLFHVCARYFSSVPAYCLMPDHFHLLMIGLHHRSDQLAGMEQLRRELNKTLRPGWQLQDQAFDHVLRENDRQADAFPDVVGYIFRNPVRAKLVDRWEEWKFSGACFPGYPKLDPRKHYFWDNFWKAYRRQGGNE